MNNHNVSNPHPTLHSKEKVIFSMNRDQLNQYYRPLHLQAQELHAILTQFLDYPIQMGWFNGHYTIDDHGGLKMDYYPIPVISIMGLCDLELDQNQINLTSKLSRQQALNFDYSLLTSWPYTVYPVEDFLLTLDASNPDRLRTAIQANPEDEFAVSICLPSDIVPEDLISFLTQLDDWGFYY